MHFRSCPFGVWRGSSVAALLCFFFLTTALAPVAAIAQDPAPDGAPAVTEPETGSEEPGEESSSDPVADQIKSVNVAAHQAWMLTCSALVLFMTAPGLAMFYGGLVRRKNVLSVLMQCVFLMGLMTVVWALWGYTLCFGGDNAWIGNFDHFMMNGVEAEWDEAAGASKFPMFDDNLTMLTHMLFQGMFFIITPALICGAFAERMKFSAMTLFLVLWGTLVYCPLCHWVWDGGILAYVPDGETGNGILGGALDFAGGTVVHISSGVSALVCALLIGKRLGFGTEPMPPHNLTYTALGAGMLWVGWFGFNAGSELASDSLASSAFAVTHFSAAAGAITWAGIEWMTRGKPSMLGAASGAVAGLVCITPGAGFVNTMPALLMGVIAAAICYYACTTLKSKLGYDDSLDAFGVHGVGGTVGALLTGVFSTRAVTSINNAQPLSLVDGGGVRLLIGQIVAVLITLVYAAVVSFVLLKVIDALIGLRVNQEDEIQGLDLSQHGEEGYINL